MRAATLAPSAMNTQPWAFGVIEGVARLRALSDRVKADLLGRMEPTSSLQRYRDRLDNPTFSVFYDAPLLVVIYARPVSYDGRGACAMAAHSLMLAAADEGLGTCWIGFAEPLFDSPAMKAELGVPASYRVVAPVIVGHPAAASTQPFHNEPEIVYWQQGDPERSSGGTHMTLPLSLERVDYETLVARAEGAVASGVPAHLHTTPPRCLITGAARRAIVLEIPGDARPSAWFSDEPVEVFAKPLAILLHGADSVPNDDEALAPASEAVERMAEMMRGGHGHFHIVGPACQVNSHPGQWTILFEDDELGVLESVSYARPLADIRLVERLIYT